MKSYPLAVACILASTPVCFAPLSAQTTTNSTAAPAAPPQGSPAASHAPVGTMSTIVDTATYLNLVTKSGARWSLWKCISILRRASTLEV